MARIVEKHLPGRRSAVYYYQHSYRVKVDPEAEGKGPGSGSSRVKTDSVYLGTAEQIRDCCRLGSAPQAVAVQRFGWVAAVASVIEQLGLIDTAPGVADSQEAVPREIALALAVVANLCQPVPPPADFSAWLDTTIWSERWHLPTAELVASALKLEADRRLSGGLQEAAAEFGDVPPPHAAHRIDEAVWNAIRQRAGLEPADDVLCGILPSFPASAGDPGDAGARRRASPGGTPALAVAVTRDERIPLWALGADDPRLAKPTAPELLARLVEGLFRCCPQTRPLIVLNDTPPRTPNPWRQFIQLNGWDPGRVTIIGQMPPAMHPELWRLPLTAYPQTLGALRVWSGRRQLDARDVTIVLTYDAALAARQRRAFDHRLAWSRRRLTAYWAQMDQGTLAERRKQLTARQMRMQHGGPYWKVTVNAEGTLKLSPHLAARSRRRAAFGKRRLFSTDPTRSAEDILTAYNHDAPQLAADWRALTDNEGSLRGPRKASAHSAVSVLSLAVLKLLERAAKRAGIPVDADTIRRTLCEVDLVTLEMAPGRTRHLVTQRSTVQQQLFDALELSQFVP